MPEPVAEPARRASVHRWVRRVFLLWAVVSTAWIIHSYRTRGVPEALLLDSATVRVHDGGATLEFAPVTPVGDAALVFLCGAGVAAEAYAPLLHSLAEAGWLVVVVRLPYRLAPLESHKLAAIQRVRNAFAAHGEIAHWVVAGHSLGAALACRVLQAEPEAVTALVLLGTTHPKQDDLSGYVQPVTKVYATEDGVAPPDRMFAHRALLPAHTRWVEIAGGNHSQFGHYGEQLFDGEATLSREAQQDVARQALRDALDAAGR